MKVFGKAQEFYRARIITTSEDETAEFEWRDDILYRKGQEKGIQTKDTYLVEIVNLDTGKEVIFKKLGDLREAQHLLSILQEDLAALTKSEFDSKYLNKAQH